MELNENVNTATTDDELWEKFSWWHTDEYKWTPRAQKDSSLGQWEMQREWKAFRCAFRLAESLLSNVQIEGQPAVGLSRSNAGLGVAANPKKGY